MDNNSNLYLIVNISQGYLSPISTYNCFTLSHNQFTIVSGSVCCYNQYERTSETENMALNYNNITITNDFMFGSVMSDPEICRRFLEQILEIKIHHVVMLEREKTMNAHPGSHGIRLDIYLEDEKSIFNCEMQRVNTGNLPKRSRYYQGQIDAAKLEQGASYQELKKSYVIFVCTFDMFGAGRYIYTFENYCRQDHSISLDDEAIKVFINTKGTKGNVSEDFKELMAYFNNHEIAKESKNGLVLDLDQAVTKRRMNPKWRDAYMTWEMYGQDCREQGRAEGKAEGQREMIFTLIKNGTLSLDEAKKYIVFTDTELEELTSLTH